MRAIEGKERKCISEMDWALAIAANNAFQSKEEATDIEVKGKIKPWENAILWFLLVWYFLVCFCIRE